MCDCGNARARPSRPLDSDYAETVILHAYVLLPLLPRQADGTCIAPLKRFGPCELRLVECAPGSATEAALRVELFDRRVQSVIESRACVDVDDAIAAFWAMLPSAERRAQAFPYHG
jgi:hypothetical protein